MSDPMHFLDRNAILKKIYYVVDKFLKKFSKATSPISPIYFQLFFYFIQTPKFFPFAQIYSITLFNTCFFKQFLQFFWGHHCFQFIYKRLYCSPLVKQKAREYCSCFCIPPQTVPAFGSRVLNAGNLCYIP